MKYELIRYPSTWEVYNKETKRVVVEGPMPYEPSHEVSDFFIAVLSCTSDAEVMKLYGDLVAGSTKNTKCAPPA